MLDTSADGSRCSSGFVHCSSYKQAISSRRCRNDMPLRRPLRSTLTVIRRYRQPRQIIGSLWLPVHVPKHSCISLDFWDIDKIMFFGLKDVSSIFMTTTWPVDSTSRIAFRTWTLLHKNCFLLNLDIFLYRVFLDGYYSRNWFHLYLLEPGVRFYVLYFVPRHRRGTELPRDERTDTNFT